MARGAEGKMKLESGELAMAALVADSFTEMFAGSAVQGCSLESLLPSHPALVQLPSAELEDRLPHKTAALSTVNNASILHIHVPCYSGLLHRYNLCSPPGASVRDVPVIGPGLANLYLNLLQTVNSSPPRADGDASIPGVHYQRRESPATDRFTTNYYFADGSYGSITCGNYTTVAGDHVNLVTGDYELANGQRGNIYQENSSDEPNTSALPMPTPFTSSGVGSAIPASEVGGQATYSSLPTPLLPPFTTTSATVGNGNNSTTGGIMPNTTGGTFAGSGTGASSASATGGPEITPPVTSNGGGHILHGERHRSLIGLAVLAAGIHHIAYR
ncbi:hypothetical protein A1O1_04713 [Capronia coronata CBS 617.96]|uniref:Uncharacterized protein n=1 Tax=Capronia coronata CBS 617.96 TaxID=1182541 RepID=W9YEU9_9EURO|nr:uncharacterized protein A1O1_04713 [Capronia coronata CBS 617.96]EXJ87786.1 hypothetical protein A1O1_04713 [Capronia coronata CBS 617.96]